MIGSPGEDQVGSNGEIILPTVTISPVEGHITTILPAEIVENRPHHQSPAVRRYQRYLGQFIEQDEQDEDAATVPTPSFRGLFTNDDNSVGLQEIPNSIRTTSAPEFRRVHSDHQSLPGFRPRPHHSRRARSTWDGSQTSSLSTLPPIHISHQNENLFHPLIATSSISAQIIGPLSPETPVIRPSNEPSLVPEMRGAEHLKKIATNLYCRGFLDGLYSDVAVHALGATFNLHKIVLLQNDYFASMLQGGWAEREAHDLFLRFDDSNITAEGLAVVFARVYGQLDVHLTPKNVCGVLAASSFFNDKELGEMCAEFIIATLDSKNVADYMMFADERYYGSRSEAILDACFSFLCQHGLSTQSEDDESKPASLWARSLRDALVRLPIHWVERILSSDCFFAPTEFDRFCLIRDVIVHRRRNLIRLIEQAQYLDNPIPSSDDDDGDSLRNHSNTDGKKTTDTEFSTLSGLERERIIEDGKERGISFRTKSRITSENVNSDEDGSLEEAFEYDEEYDSFEDIDALQDFESDENGSPSCSSNVIATSIAATNSLSSISKQLQEEEQAYKTMLSHATIYSHMHFDQLLTIRDLEIIPERILQRAFWSQQELRMLVESAGELTSELGIRNSATGVPTDDTDKIDGKRLSDMQKGPIYTHRSARFPPYRFGVEFSDLKRLHGGGRCYSSIMQYAGSYWVIYLQKIVLDQPKLGVYLQRWQPEEGSCAPPSSLTALAGATTPISTTSSSVTNAESKLYSDRRIEVRTWFKLYCFFANRKCYVLESKPDVFKNTQSWGWRSNKLYKDAFLVDMPKKSDTLRCCVVMGHI